MRPLRLACALLLSVTGCDLGEVVSPAPLDDQAAAGDGGHATCDVFEDEPASTPVRFRVRNETDRPIYVQVRCERLLDRTVSCPSEDFTFEDDPCATSCEQQQAPPVACGGCPSYVLRVLPGDAFTDVWDGLGLRPVAMPAGCFDDGVEKPCERRVGAPSGEYFVSLDANTRCPSCACQDDGRCSTPALGNERDAHAVGRFTLPRETDDDVVLAFDGR